MYLKKFFFLQEYISYDPEGLGESASGAEGVSEVEALSKVEFKSDKKIV